MYYRIVSVLWTLVAQLLVPFVHLNNKVWIISSTKNQYFNYNSRYFFEYLLKRETVQQVYFVIDDKGLRNQLIQKFGPHFINTRSLQGIIKVLQARVWVSSAGLPIHLLLDKHQRLVVNLWHGVPLKRILLLENKISWYQKLYIRYFFSSHYTAVIATTKRLIPLYVESFGVDSKQIQVLGQPRNDQLQLDTQYQFLKLFPDSKFYKKILYAPTYREWGTTCLFPFKDFDIKQLENFLTEHSAIIYIRYHLQNKDIHQLYETEHIKFINEDKVEDIMQLLNNFDLLITDYSSIYIDYLILNRPIIFMPYDLSIYRSQRGFNFDYKKVTPGYHVTLSMADFYDKLQQYLKHPDIHHIERKRINHFFNEVTVNSNRRVEKFIVDQLKSKNTIK